MSPCYAYGICFLALLHRGVSQQSECRLTLRPYNGNLCNSVVAEQSVIVLSPKVFHVGSVYFVPCV